MCVVTTPRTGRSERRLRSGGAYEACKRVVFARESSCWLCGQEVNQNLKWPHPKSKSLDHVVPLVQLRGMSLADAKAIACDPDRAHLAHLSCNISRGARMRNGTEQRRVASRTW